MSLRDAVPYAGPATRRTALCALLLAALLVTLSALAMPAPARAQGATSMQPRARQTASGHVTIIVLDMSGSMAANDPDGLRCSAAKAYIDLSGIGDDIGVVGLSADGSAGPNGFGGAQTWATPATIETAHDRDTLKQTIA